ncbi:hypothetical protein J7K41_03235 [Candidatus Micrarchaeota archaeon]|nr:hypothetical protein [Candidatus Micrarchaeota archaeon]
MERNVLVNVIGLGALVALLVLSGCFSVTVEQQVHKNGDSTLTYRMNLSKLFSLAAASKNITPPTEDEICKNYTEKGIKCSYSNGVVTLEKDVKLSEADFYTFDVKQGNFGEKTYKVVITKMPKIPSANSSSNTSMDLLNSTENVFTDPSAPMAAQMYRTMGINITYVVKMPAKVTKAEGAVSVKDNVAVFDVLERLEHQKNIVVEAKEEGSILYIVLGIGAVIVIALIGIAISKMKRK